MILRKFHEGGEGRASISSRVHVTSLGVIPGLQLPLTTAAGSAVAVAAGSADSGEFDRVVVQ